ncbi:MAG: hypothetical protein A3A86_07155 [Elusimicrobia bacterium RIFCSPLOWO2_01_FULL_60_11]|nr:MAG: hypothetical protein A3A86_07155 [Elusimicrobia bacterium RIFCSPLOWO2_01_FULL_60_11]
MKFVDDYESVLKKFNSKNIRYVVIGVFGINYYANDPGNRVLTQDCDILLKPLVKNLLDALKILMAEGFNLESNGEPLGDVDAWLVKKLIERRSVVTARKGDVLRIDLVIEGGGIPYSTWEKNRRLFKAGNTRIYVGDLPQLLRAKENANREKDRKFLALYKIQLKEMLDAHKQKTKK